jgi:hypothetical protein
MNTLLLKIDELLLNFAWDDPDVVDYVQQQAFYAHDDDLKRKTQHAIETYRKIKDGISVSGGSLFEYAVENIPGKGKGIVVKQEIKKGDITFIFRDMITFNEEELRYCLAQLESDLERGDFLTYLFTTGDDGYWPKPNVAVFDCNDFMYCNHESGVDDMDYSRLCNIAPRDFAVGDEYCDNYREYQALPWFDRLCATYNVLSCSQCCVLIEKGVFKRGNSNTEFMVEEKE